MTSRIHTTQLRVRYAECDSMQFVHHAKYIEYFELGRTDLIRAAAKSYGAFEAEGVLLPVVHIDIRYHRPAHYDDDLRIETRVLKVSKAQVEFGNRVLSADGATVHCEGEVGLACINRQGKPQRIPTELLTPLQTWLEGGGA